MSPQETIAHYRITAKLGEGGMGEVWRATDTKLNRDVAIKKLPAAFAEDPARMARFEREAQLLAALNHPNIAAIYGIEQGALVMEFVDGADLKGPLPIDTALDYARQIAGALEAAHDKGIIHRDLKPANIKVTPEGQVKLLDFGLAKATEESSAISTRSPTMSPTLSLGMTQSGVILGTAAYMSPEQARGKAVDKRADIWAFGVVLYEMLTGRLLFGGDTLTDTIAAVVKTDPDWTALPADTPTHIRWLLERCLRKDPGKRLQSIGDVRLLMDEPPGESGDRARQSATLPWLPLVATALMAAFVTAGTMWWFQVKPVDMVNARFVMHLPEGTVATLNRAAPQTVPSPDGRYLAFAAMDLTNSKSYLWLRPLGSLSAQRFDKSEGASFPFWSPDGQFIGFFADQKLKKVAVAGGIVQTICDTPQGTGDGGTWNHSGTIIFAPGQDSPLLQVPAAGGSAAPVTSVDANRRELGHGWPQFLPDGRHFVYFARSADSEKSGVYIQELGAAKRNLLLQTLNRADFAPPGYLLFVRDVALYAQRLNLKNFTLEGDPVLVTEEVNANASNGRASFAVSPAGVLVYFGNFPRSRQLTWYSRDGKRLGTVGEPGEYSMMRVSPDERYVALMQKAGAGTDTWIMDLGSGIRRRITFGLKQAPYGPVWSPDSKRIAVSLVGVGIREIVAASGTSRDLFSTTQMISADDWSPDGQVLLYVNDPPTRINLLPLSLESVSGDRKIHVALDTPYLKYGLRFSPDGRWAAYTSNESGDFELYVSSFPSFDEKHRVSADGSLYPVWRKDGRELFFAKLEGQIMAAEVKNGPKFEVGLPKPLFKINVMGFGQFAPFGDGSRFLVNEIAGQNEAEITVITNWMANLKH